MYCVNCGTKIDYHIGQTKPGEGIIQAVENAVRRIYREEQKVDNERIRAIVCCECERILEEKSKEERILK